MKTRLIAAAALALAGAAALPASAQVNGIGTVNVPAAIYSTQALETAYTQIFQTYQAQMTQLQQTMQQRDALMAQFDTNQDGQLDQAEMAAAQSNTAAVQQLQGLNQTIAQLQQPITAAQVYAIEQILMQYSAAAQQVIQEKNVQLILAPEAIVYAPQEVSLNDEVVAALNQRVPAVSTAVPEGWRPQQDSVAIWEQVQEIIQTLSAMRQAQAQQGQAAPATPATPVQGR
jgi:Skp family chaperone for outer membrane proteins